MLTKEPLRLPYQAVEGRGPTEGFTSLIVDDLIHRVLDKGLWSSGGSGV